MLQVAGIALAISILLSATAIISVSRSTAAAKWLMVVANGSTTLAAIEVVLANELGGVGDWAFLFACGACGSGAVAVRNLNQRSTRWVHRFVIYAGYAAIFAAMSATGLWLHARDASGKLAAAVFVGVYIVGSILVFVAKTLTLRITAKTMPEYHASLGADQRGWR